MKWKDILSNTRQAEERKEIETGYKVIAKDDSLYLIFDGWVVIRKLDAQMTTAEINQMIKECINNQINFQGLNYEMD